MYNRRLYGGPESVICQVRVYFDQKSEDQFSKTSNSECNKSSSDSPIHGINLNSIYYHHIHAKTSATRNVRHEAPHQPIPAIFNQCRHTLHSHCFSAQSPQKSHQDTRDHITDTQICTRARAQTCFVDHPPTVEYASISSSSFKICYCTTTA